jgi:hypothetical protein
MSDSPASTKIRKDGWTAERQLRFLDSLASTHSATKAARVAGMSREGAYRFLNRDPGSLFAALWNLALAPRMPNSEVHTEMLSAGRVLRLLGNHHRRERGDFLDVGMARARARAA